MTASLIGAVASHILAMPAWAALLAVFALPALESSAFVGFVFPGEIALILGGVLAAHGTIPLAAVLVAGVLGAVLGDSVGYAVGRRYGRRLLEGSLGRVVRRHHLDRAESYLAQRGGRAVLLGRFTAALRVMVPGLAGMSRMPYRSFLRYNVAGGLVWGAGSVLLGYLGGASWQHAAHLASQAGLVALGVLLLMVLGGAALRRRRRHRTGATAVPLLPPPEPGGAVVVIPTYQEAATITTVLDEVLRAAPAVDVLVVDDSSPDGTASLVRAHPGSRAGQVHLLSRPAKEGLGAAYRAGFAWALAHGYAAVAQMDADLSHPPDRLPELLAALETADVAVGSRYVPGGAVRDWPATRRLLSAAANRYARTVLQLPVRDTTAGFKAFRRSALQLLDTGATSSDGYCFQIENTRRAVRLGLRVAEVPITFTDRTAGTSKMSARIAVEALVRVLVWGWQDLRGRAVPAGIADLPVDDARGADRTDVAV